MFHVMVLKGKFLYVIRACVSIEVVILRCKQFSNCLKKYVNKSGMVYWLVMCELCMELA